MNSLSKTCYWCSAPATSKEHVPPRNLFPDGKNKNLITVPSCTAHNQDFGKFDEKFRVYLQARESSSDALNEFKTTTLRGLNRPRSQGLVKSLASNSVPVTVGGQRTLAFKVNPHEQNLYFEKIIRGLYFHLYQRPLSGSVASISEDFIDPNFDYAGLREFTKQIFSDPNLTKEAEVANPDIFRYKYFRTEIEGREAFAIKILFYKGVEVVGFSRPNV